MAQRKLLIATTNPGKFKEMQEFFHTQPFELVSLADVGITEAPEEPFDTVELNAYAKAKFYGEKSGIISLVTSGENFSAIALYDPTDTSVFVSLGEDEGNKALVKLEYFLKKQYGARNIVVPFALVIQDGKLLMQKRNDPHRPDYHEKWEFPGGGVDFKEKMIESVIRETKEETGLEVEPLKLLQHIGVEWQEYPTFAYQVYLVPYVCKIVGGKMDPRDQEVLELQWFHLDEVLQFPLVGENARMFEKLLPELKEVIQKNNL